jgi:hypothetical protein
MRYSTMHTYQCFHDSMNSRVMGLTPECQCQLLDFGGVQSETIHSRCCRVFVELASHIENDPKMLVKR